MACKGTPTTMSSSVYLSSRVCSSAYAVRGLVPTRAMAIQQEMEQRARNGLPNHYPFDRLVFSNIGNPQALGSPPLTYPRQVLSLLDYPAQLTTNGVSAYPSDVVRRAQCMLKEMRYVTGAYTDSAGYRFVREHVATYITERDRVHAPHLPVADANHIYLTDGASSGVKALLQLFVDTPTDAVLIPVPQYPLYTATISLLGGAAVPYYLEEQHGWGICTHALQCAYDAARSKGTTPRLLVVINPGNPTGQVLTVPQMEDVIAFAAQHQLTVLADEVYQDNVHVDEKTFHSFRQVLLASPHRDCVTLVTVHSTSKGILGECGRRGGYLETINMPQSAQEELTKLMSINLCANVSGQLLVDLMVHPPREGDESYASFRNECTSIRASLRRRSQLLYDALNTMPGIQCNPIEGAMYAFPALHLSSKYLAYHQEQNEKEQRTIEPDTRWSLDLLESKGIVVVPGSGFGQAPGTYHFRTTILPQEPELAYMVEQIRAFQLEHKERFDS